MFLFSLGGETITTIHDGTLVIDESTAASKSVFGLIKGIFSSNDNQENYAKLDKAGELEKGMLAMLPVVCSELEEGKPVRDLISTILDVDQRQKWLAQYYIWPGNQAKGPNEVFQVSSLKLISD